MLPSNRTFSTKFGRLIIKLSFTYDATFGTFLTISPSKHIFKDEYVFQVFAFFFSKLLCNIIKCCVTLRKLFNKRRKSLMFLLSLVNADSDYNWFDKTAGFKWIGSPKNTNVIYFLCFFFMLLCIFFLICVLLTLWNN